MTTATEAELEPIDTAEHAMIGLLLFLEERRQCSPWALEQLWDKFGDLMAEVHGLRGRYENLQRQVLTSAESKQ